MLVTQENYKKQMDEIVLPYLKGRKEECYAEREKGKSIHFNLYEAESPRGIVVISHGFSETAIKHTENIYYFVKEGYNVCAVDHCGHGRSYRLTKNDSSLVHIDDYRRYVQDLTFVSKAVSERHQNLPLYLFAHSMGGGIAAAAVAEEPTLYKKVVLSSPMIRPNTGKVPWVAAKLLADLIVLFGKGVEYLPGHTPFSPGEKFEDSASMAEERFAYYQAQREKEVLYQTSGGSYAWFRAAACLNHYLRTKAVSQIRSEILLLQAENDGWVSCKEQELFVKRIQKHGKAKASLVKMSGVKHEIYNSCDEILEVYWRKIFNFLED